MKKLKQLSTFSANWRIQLSTCPASRESGMTLIFSLIILGNILVIALAVGIFSLNQIKIATSIRDSAYAIFAGTSGLEKAFYDIRIKSSNCAVNPLSGTLANNASYSVALDCASSAVSDCDAPKTGTIITSNGQYGPAKTTRTIEASWCN